MPLIQYAAAALGSAIVIAVTSLVWPKVTAQTRPEQLTQVREIVMKTQMGQNAARVLGVTDEANVTPMSVEQFMQEQASAVVANVASSAQSAVTNKVFEQLATKFHSLPDAQKQEFQKLICKPVQ